METVPVAHWLTSRLFPLVAKDVLLCGGLLLLLLPLESRGLWKTKEDVIL